MDTKQEIVTLEGHEDEVRSLAFSSDGSTLASGSRDATVRLWDIGSFEHKGTFEAGQQAVALSVAFSPDGSIVAFGAVETPTKLWDIATGKCTATLDGHRAGAQSVAFFPDGIQLASAGFDGRAISLDS